MNEIIVVIVLTLLNGFFSCSEIALITVRKTRIAELVKQGNKRAKIIQELRSNPEIFFATIQIGASIITIFASAYAGASIASEFSESIRRIPLRIISDNAYSFSFGIIVFFVAYINLVIGELVPKSLGLRFSESISLFSAYPIWWLSRISGGLVKILNRSSNILLKPFKDSTSFIESRLSEEEIRGLISEGQRTGAISAHEHSLIENIFDVGDITTGKAMTPRSRIIAFDINKPASEIIRESIESGFSRIPIYQDTLNNVVGILYTKKLLTMFGSQEKITDLSPYLVPPYFAPSSMKLSNVLQRLQRKHSHVALITDEHGDIEGLITLEDILEQIVGEIRDETDETVKTLIFDHEGQNMVLGELSIIDFNKHFGAELPEDEDFSTISGFILERLGRFPAVGDKITHNNIELTVHEKTPRTVKTAIVKKLD